MRFIEWGKGKKCSHRETFKCKISLTLASFHGLLYWCLASVYCLVKGSVTPVATVPPSGRCSKDQFLCLKPATCIADWKRCDGHPHCQDGSDETNCRKCRNILTHLLTLYYRFPHFGIEIKSLNLK